jgi:hypothetical protein
MLFIIIMLSAKLLYDNTLLSYMTCYPALFHYFIFSETIRFYFYYKIYSFRYVISSFFNEMVLIFHFITVSKHKKNV